MIVYGDCLELDEYVDGTSMTRETVGRHIVEYAMDGGEGNHNEDVEVHIDGINCGLIIIYYTLRAPSEAMQESAVRAIATNEHKKMLIRGGAPKKATNYLYRGRCALHLRLDAVSTEIKGVKEWEEDSTLIRRLTGNDLERSRGFLTKDAVD